MKKAGTFLCGIMAAVLITGCGSIMPDLTQEETEIISEYAVGVLLKYDRVYSGRLMSMSEYEEEENKKAEREAAKEAAVTNEEESTPEESPEDTAEVVDVSQDEESAELPSTIEEYYGIQDIAFQYTGFELTESYPSSSEGEEVFFAMDATEGMQLLVLKFAASNLSSSDQTLDMLGYGARFRISVNGGAGENALSTMLLNDLQSYRDVIPAGSSEELVCIVEVPQSTNVETIDMTLRGDAGNAVISLQ